MMMISPSFSSYYFLLLKLIISISIFYRDDIINIFFILSVAHPYENRIIYAGIVLNKKLCFLNFYAPNQLWENKKAQSYA
jgi:hypothetical protein